MTPGAIRPNLLSLKEPDDGEFSHSLSLALSSLSSSYGCSGVDSQPQTPSESGQCTPTQQYDAEVYEVPATLGHYKLVQRVAGVSSHKAVLHYDVDTISTNQRLLCKIFPKNLYQRLQKPYYVSGDHENVLKILDIIHHDNRVFVIHPRIHGDLHTYLRDKRKLKESESCHLLEQIVKTVYHCHSRSIVLRDLKLRKFVFTDPERRYLALDSFEDAIVLDNYADDLLDDKHGCPAYVSPEIISRGQGAHSGRAADIWSLGVIAYILMVGRYPFHHRTPSLLFGKIRRAKFTVPSDVSPSARNLISCLLRFEPGERMPASQILRHPLFSRARLQFATCTDANGDDGLASSAPNSVAAALLQPTCPKRQHSASTTVSDVFDHCVPEFKVARNSEAPKSTLDQHQPFPMF